MCMIVEAAIKKECIHLTGLMNNILVTIHHFVSTYTSVDTSLCACLCSLCVYVCVVYVWGVWHHYMCNTIIVCYITCTEIWVPFFQACVPVDTSSSISIKNNHELLRCFAVAGMYICVCLYICMYVCICRCRVILSVYVWRCMCVHTHAELEITIWNWSAIL